MSETKKVVARSAAKIKADEKELAKFTDVIALVGTPRSATQAKIGDSFLEAELDAFNDDIALADIELVVVYNDSVVGDIQDPGAKYIIDEDKIEAYLANPNTVIGSKLKPLVKGGCFGDLNSGEKYIPLSLILNK